MNPLIELQDLGWDRRWESLFEEHALRGLVPARVLSEERGRYLVASAEAEGPAVVSGRFRNGARAADEFPAVGDWVLLELPAASDAIIQAVLPRRSRFARAARGDVPGAQVAAANVDLVLVVAALDHDFNLARLERYLALAWSSGAEPTILLNKADLRPDVGEALGLVRSVAPAVPVYPLSAREGSGLDPVRALLEPGRTVALLGSSGVGKSTIVNALLGWERQAVREVREGDSRGRHTTTVRELIRLPSGALLIDSPGMRSVGMWEAEDGLASAFADVDALAAQCRFSDCSHATEPGCAVQAAIADGSLAAQRLHSRQKLERELAAIERRRSPDRAELRRNGRRMTKFVRNRMRTKYGDDAA
ncbi:MAG TPA: ribosome small subunit-dependent GTPase A [Candidatus Limnocylindria bacterium]|nr:ribosome small subunit-dependent GTPase A [Candidatus Limnocylindria bacterium]